MLALLCLRLTGPPPSADRLELKPMPSASSPTDRTEAADKQEVRQEDEENADADQTRPAVGFHTAPAPQRRETQKRAQKSVCVWGEGWVYECMCMCVRASV